MALTEADRLELDLIRFQHARRLLWMILKSNGGYTLEHFDMEDYPGDEAALIDRTYDPASKAVTLMARRA